MDQSIHVLRLQLQARWHVDELAAWCNENGLAMNGQARARFAAEKGLTLAQEI